MARLLPVQGKVLAAAADHYEPRGAVLPSHTVLPGPGTPRICDQPTNRVVDTLNVRWVE